MNIEEKKNFLIDVLYKAFFVGVAILVCKFVLPHCIPFIIGFILAAIIKKTIEKWGNKFFKNNKIASISLLVIVYCLLFGVILALTALSFNIVGNIANYIGNLYQEYAPTILNYSELIRKLPLEMQDFASNLVKTVPTEIGNIIGDLSKWAISFAAKIVQVAPEILVNIIITLIASFFITIDYDNITSYIAKKTPDKVKKWYLKIKDYVTKKLWVVIKSYLLIMFITFAELCIGLGILRVSNFISVAAIISFLDILPVLGVGTAVIPWSIYCFITGDSVLAIGLLAVYVVITIIRNIIEPKMVGNNLGLHPVVSLMTMFIGLKMFGIIGLFLFPIILSFILYIKDIKKDA